MHADTTASAGETPDVPYSSAREYLTLEFGRISLPTNNPGLCQRCKRKHTLGGHTKPVHWSIRAQAWLCLWCHFEAPDAENV